MLISRWRRTDQPLAGMVLDSVYLVTGVSCGRVLAWDIGFDLIPTSLFNLWIVGCPDIGNALINRAILTRAAIRAGIGAEARLAGIINTIPIGGRANRDDNGRADLNGRPGRTGWRSNSRARHFMISRGQ